MKKIISLTIFSLMSIFMFSIATPQTAMAANEPVNCSSAFLTFPTWYKGLTNDKCEIIAPGSDITLPDGTTSKMELSNFIWHIVLNVLAILIMAVSYIATFYIIYGGFIYLTSLGYPEELVKARKTILNAVIGLVISIVSVAMVNLVSDSILK